VTDSPLAELVSQRLAQAAEALEEARLLAEANHPRGSVNRSYYAMFYSVQALLAQAGLKTSKHSGAIALFDREFVKKGTIEKEFSRNLHRLFDLRQDSDYGDLFEADAERAKEVLEQARAFVERVRTHLAQDTER
jgi:uncharacterized protein (UPF0332 family)